MQAFIAFRAPVWAVLFFFSFSSIPHVDMVLKLAGNLFSSPAYAAEAEAPAPQDTQPEAASTSAGTSTSSPDQAAAPDTTQTTEASATQAETVSPMDTGSGGGGSATSLSLPTASTMLYTGAATVTIPIEVPPGKAGIAPNLALTYNSYQGNGWIGVGWTLDMGSIQRSTKFGVNYTGNNANSYVTVLNGATSELVSRSDWGSNYYGAKIEGGLSQYLLTNSAPNGDGGWSWVVTSKDGTKYYYGTTSASRQTNKYGTFAWYLDKVEDANGNYMTVTYTQNQGQIYLNAINYTGNSNTGLSPSNSVQFYLDGTRSDLTHMFPGNTLVVTASRLKTIDVSSNGTRVRTYKLTYGASAFTSQSLLSTVQQYGNDATVDGSGNVTGGSALPATTSAYSPENGTFSRPVGSYPGINLVGYSQSIGDVNGDGNADIIYTASTSSELYVYTLLSNGDGTFSRPVGSYPGINLVGYSQSIGDVNGDGNADIIYTASTSSELYVYTLLSNGDGTFSPPTGSRFSINLVGYSQSIGDVNGDGNADIIYSYSDGVNSYFYTLLSNGDGTFSKPIYSCALGYNLTSYSQQLGDVNGDGKTDIIYTAPTSSELYVYVLPASGPPSNLLTTVTTPLGGATTFTYTPTSAYYYYNTNLPFILQTVSQIQTTDGVANHPPLTTGYTYDGGYYYAPDRDFRGFAIVTAYQASSGMSGPGQWQYTTKTQTTFYQDGVLKGAVGQTYVDGIEGSSRLVGNTYDSMYVSGPNAGQTGCVPNSTTACFPRLSQTVTCANDSGYTPYTYRTAYTYDPTYLNITEEDKYGAQWGTTSIDVHTSLVYTSSNPSFVANWIVAKPTNVTVEDNQHNIVSSKWIDYDPATGNPLDEEVCLSTTPNTGCTARNPSQNAFTSYTYYPDGNVNTITDPLNHMTTLTYDATLTYVATSTNALGQVTSTTYNPGLGKITQTIPPYLQGTGYSFAYAYDVFGRLHQANRPDGGYTAYSYLNIGSPASQYLQRQEHIVGGASVLDHYVVTYFDGLGRSYETSATGPSTANIMTQTTYDPLGRVSSKTNPYFVGGSVYSTTYTYDGLSRVTNTNIPDVNTSYNIMTSYQGLTKVVTDQNNHTVTSTSDVFGRPTSVQDAYGAVTQYTYDARNNLLQVVAAVGAPQQNTTSMTYDSMGRKISMTDPDMGYWTYAYDKAGNLVSQTDAKNQTITFAYDALNRILTKTYSDHTVTYTYDSASVPYSTGKLTSTSTTLNGETESDLVLGFDIMQRVTSSQKNIGTNSVTIAKTYDSAGRTYQLTYFPNTPSQKVYSYTYDQAGDILSLHDDTNNRYIAQYNSFTALGQYQSATYPKPNASVTSQYTYDPATGKIATLFSQMTQGGTATTYQNLSYAFDPKGNLLTKTDSLENLTHAYTYDSLDRLNAVNGSGAFIYSQTYAYDAIGNILCKSDVGSYTYNYGNQPHAVQSAGNITLQYDTNGNMTQRAVSGGNTLGFTYNQDNMPTGITQNGSSYVAYTYDENGQRIRKQNLFTGNTVLYFGDAYEVRGSVGVIHLFTGTQRVVSIRTDGYEQWYLSDHLGSASIVTDQTGAIQERIDYFPYGTFRERSDYSSTFPAVNYTFTDQEDDDDTGLYNYKSRLYDPVLGRFLTPDSIVPDPGNLQSYNRYSYCLNNPLIYTDPSGHSWGIFSDIGHFFSDIGSDISDLWHDVERSSVGQAVITGMMAAASFAAFVILETGTWGTATPLASAVLAASTGQLAAAGAVAGAVGGGLGAALEGGNIIQGALMGAAIGGLTGGITGSFSGAAARAIAGGVFAAAGAGAAYAQGGLDGLANFGAGLVGAYVGAEAVNWIADPPTSAPSDPENWNYVKATREGLVGGTTASGMTIGENSTFVALPDRSALGASVDLFYSGKSIDNVPVEDVGPWNTTDPYWTTGARPLAESQGGTNGAGIDLSNKVYRDLGVNNNGSVYWRFH